MIPHKVFSPDWLHALAVGVYKDYLTTLWHRLVEVNLFRVSGTGTAARLQESIGHVTSIRSGWYQMEKRRPAGAMQSCHG